MNLLHLALTQSAVVRKESFAVADGVDVALGTVERCLDHLVTAGGDRMRAQATWHLNEDGDLVVEVKTDLLSKKMTR